MKNILMVGDANGIFIKNLSMELKKRYECSISALTFYHFIDKDNVYEYQLVLRPFVKNLILNYFNLFLKLLKHIKLYKRFDTIMVHYVSSIYLLYWPIFKFMSSNIVLIPWGSDIFRVSKKKYIFLKILYSLANKINFCTTAMKNKVDEISGHTIDKYKITHCRFGISQIKYIDKMLKIDNMQDLCFDLLNIPFTYSKFKIIVVGYNGSPNQQHFDIINSLSKYNWNDDLFIFPFTYGGTKLYRKKLEIMINKKELSYLFIDDYLSNEKIAALRVISDVLVQLQTTDALSASTQEHLYAGSRVIVGSWLPYSFLRDNGVIYETVDSVDEIGEYLNKTITNKISKYKKNHNNKIIRNLSSWDETINCWYSL